MFQRIKLYFAMKKMKRQLNYILLTHLSLFVANKEQYLTLFHSLTEINPDDFQSELTTKLTNMITLISEKTKTESVDKNEDI